MRVRDLSYAGLSTLLLLALAAGPAAAAWPHDPYNGNVLVCGALNGQAAVAMIPDGSGGAILTWLDFRGGVSNDIFAQRVSAAGVPLWSADGVRLASTTGDQINPAIASDGAGGAIVSWGDARSGTYDIYAQHLNALGALQWGAAGIAVCTATGIQVNSVIASDGSGGAIIAWTDSRSGATQDIYAQRLNAAGAPQWTANGVAVCTAANDQTAPRIVPDGSGGAIVAWQDARGAATDIYAQRLSAAGAAQWTANGLGVCTSANAQAVPALCADGSGGAVIAWQDFRSATTNDIYAQRVAGNGLVLWPSGGVAVCAAAGDQSAVSLDSDGAGGAILAWTDGRSGTSLDVYAQRMTAAGGALWTTDGVAVSTGAGDQSAPVVLPDGAGGALIGWTDTRTAAVNSDLYAQRLNPAGASQWASGGIPVCAASGAQVNPVVASDGNGGAIFGWQDPRSVTAYDIYAQRVEFYGQLGNPEPSSAGVRDVPNDQGGIVKVGWAASYLDDAPTYGILDYRVWRSAPPNAATARLALARGITTSADDAAANGRYLADPAASSAYLWEFVGSEPAAQLPGYSLVASTTADSVAAGNPRTAFMIEARTSTSVAQPHWFSAPDSGYSVDNLAPAAPAPLTGNYAAGTVHLHWNRNAESDLAGYRLYGGPLPGFVPDAGSLLAALPDTGFSGAEAAGEYYKLTAIDVHGNESPLAALSPSGIAAVGDAGPPRAFLAMSSANPVRGAGDVALRFGVAHAGRVSLVVYDAGGRRVRVLADGAREAGEFTLRWDGRDEAGTGVAPGLYFVRFESPGLSATRRIVRTG